MTNELKRLRNDPNFVVEFAVGAPSPHFERQRRGSGLTLAGVYYDDVKRYVMKSAHLSTDDHRVFDVDTGHVVLVSHHPGKNPYDALDPLGLSNTDSWYNVAGGEWQSLCDVTAMSAEFLSLKIRPKWVSRHGRQTVATAHDDRVIFNIGKISKLKSMSVRDQFMVSPESTKDLAYKCVADFVGRSISITNEHDQPVAQIAKTTKALILTAAFGKGSESTIDIAPGVDCSVILAIVFGLKQVGQHFMNDALGNYVTDPLTDMATGAAVDAAVDGLTGGDGEEGEEEAQEEAEEPEEPEEEVEEEEPEEEEEEEEEDDDDDDDDPGVFVNTAQSLFQSFFGSGGGDDDGGEEEEEYDYGGGEEEEEYDDGGGDEE